MTTLKTAERETNISCNLFLSGEIRKRIGKQHLPCKDCLKVCGKTMSFGFPAHSTVFRDRRKEQSEKGGTDVQIILEVAGPVCIL